MFIVFVYGYVVVQWSFDFYVMEQYVMFGQVLCDEVVMGCIGEFD